MTRYRTIVADPPTPWLDDGDVRLYHGDAIQTLRQLPAGIVQTCITSPPYWGLRDYGTGEWTGGDSDCDHLKADAPPRQYLDGKGRENQSNTNWDHRNEPYGAVCGHCGAQRLDSQLGLEATPETYVERMVAVFREVWRVLRPDGTLWLNLGDSYAGSWGNQGRKPERGEQRPINGDMLTPVLDGRYPDKGSNTGAVPPGLKPKDLVGIPWRVAFALQADGWYLRSDIIWSKPNPMPESVSDRPTKAHEYLFLLTKQPRYFFDADAIREPHSAGSPTHPVSQYADAVNRPMHHTTTAYARGDSRSDQRTTLMFNPAGRNRRSVWVIPTEPFPEAHFATYPQALVRPCILAGSSERGECSACGAPYHRVVTRWAMKIKRSERTHPLGHTRSSGTMLEPNRSETTGWSASCECLNIGATASSGREILPPTRPQTVLDPFIGSGTTALVARNHGRRCIGIDLSSEYLGIAAQRLQQLSLLADPA